MTAALIIVAVLVFLPVLFLWSAINVAREYERAIVHHCVVECVAARADRSSSELVEPVDVGKAGVLRAAVSVRDQAASRSAQAVRHLERVRAPWRGNCLPCC